MTQIPFWLHRPIKRFIQYWGVFFASFPAALLCFLLFRILPQPIALGLTLPVGLAFAIIVWRWLDRKIIFARKPEMLALRATSVNHFVVLQDSALGTAGAIIIAFVSFTPIRPESLAYTVPEYQSAADNLIDRTPA